MGSGEGAFLAENLPPAVSLVGAAAGEGFTNQVYLPPPVGAIRGCDRVSLHGCLWP